MLLCRSPLCAMTAVCDGATMQSTVPTALAARKPDHVYCTCLVCLDTVEPQGKGEGWQRLHPPIVHALHLERVC